MKSYRTWLFIPAVGALMLAGNVLAQDTSATPSPSAAAETAVYNTPQGELTVHSAPASAPIIGPPPSFEQLSGGTKGITEEQAAAYPPLANDFLHADRNRNNSVSKSEYEHWLKQLK